MDLDYQDFQDQMREVVDYIGPWDKEAFADFRFAALDQWEDDDKDALRAQKRPYLVLDKTRVLLDSVSGNEIVNDADSFLPKNENIISIPGLEQPKVSCSATCLFAAWVVPTRTWTIRTTPTAGSLLRACPFSK